MNNPLNAPQSPKELVLRLIGGERDGQLFTVQKEKCLLSDLSPGLENPESCRCVIFRGEKGVAFRSYSDHVLCNGAKVSVQWLKKGDLIKLTDNFSVEVYQLGVYTRKAATVPTATRQPVHTVAMHGNTNPESSSKAVPTAPAASITPPGSDSVTTTTPQNYAKPSVQFPSVSSSPAEEAPKFKPANSNLRTPAVTSPLPPHQPPAQPPAPVTSVSRVPVVTQALDVASSTTNSLPDNEVENQSLNQQQSPTVPASSETAAVPPALGMPSTPSNETIDSLSERLSKLVDSAGGNGDVEFGDSKTANTPPSIRPSVSTMPIEPTVIETAGRPPVAAAPQSPIVVQPTAPSVSTAGTERTPAQTVLNSPVTPNVQAPDSDSPTGVPPQSTVSDSAAQRRAALESYFSKSGISLSDAATPSDDNVTPADPVSPKAAVDETVTSGQPAASAEPADVPSVPSRRVMATEAFTIASPTEQPKETAASESTATSPEFDLDSVLAKLESGSPTSSSQPPAAEPTQVQPPPVAAPSVPETPVVETPVVASTVGEPPAADALAQTPAETESNDEPAQATDGGQGGQLESFALLQSLGLDTSGLGQIKKELTEAPLREEIESTSLNTDQQVEPETAAPEKVESVADVLARMQNSGSLQDFNAGEAEAESSATEVAPHAPSTPSPASPPVASAESSLASDEAGDSAEDDGSVEDYMSQLLNRMRGDSEPTSGEVAEQKQDNAVEKIAAEQQLEASAGTSEPEKVKTLTPEEFVPKQKAFRMQSLDSLREIANSNAREAFRDSLARERKVSTQTKLTLSMVSLAFAVLFFLMSYMKEQVNFWGVVFGIGFLVIGLLTARAYLSERKLDESILSD